MGSNNNSEYNTDNLQDLTFLITDSYASLSRLSSNIEALITSTRSELPFEYLKHCIYLFSEFRSFSDGHEQVFTPYLRELYHKVSSGHNCISCSGKCRIEHVPKLGGLEHMLQEMQYMVDRTSGRLNDIYEDNREATRLAEMHKEVTLFINLLKELIYLERGRLVPEIVKAHTYINVRN